MIVSNPTYTEDKNHKGKLGYDRKRVYFIISLCASNIRFKHDMINISYHVSLSWSSNIPLKCKNKIFFSIPNLSFWICPTFFSLFLFHSPSLKTTTNNSLDEERRGMMVCDWRRNELVKSEWYVVVRTPLVMVEGGDGDDRENNER